MIRANSEHQGASKQLIVSELSIEQKTLCNYYHYYAFNL